MLLCIGDHEGSVQLEYDDLSTETQIHLTRSGANFGFPRFEEKSFFNTFSSFLSKCYHKPTNAIHFDSPIVNTSEKIMTLNTIDEIHIKCDASDVSEVNGVGQPLLHGFL